MRALLVFGISLAPLAVGCILKLSLASIAALLATRVLGSRRAASSFGFTLSSFALALVLLVAGDFVQNRLGLADGLLGRPADYAAPFGSAASSDPPLRFAAPGLVGKFGSMLQVRFEGRPVPAEAKATGSDERLPRETWLGLFGLLWLAGVGGALLYHLAGVLCLRSSLAETHVCRDPRLQRLAREAGSRLGVNSPELLLARSGGPAYTAGIFRPRIVLPRESGSWTEERLVATLLHETMHVRRHDVPAAESLRFLASLAWPSPLPWLAFASALRLREEACDAGALAAGAEPAAYASSLLETARSLSRTAGLSPSAAMSGGSDLERRILRVLEGPQPRSGGTGPLRSVAAALLLAGLSFAALCAGSLYSLPGPGPLQRGPIAAGEWLAAADPLGSPRAETQDRGSFTLSRQGTSLRIDLTYGGKRIVRLLPAAALPTTLPLSPRARMKVPFGDLVDAQSNRPFLNPGWNLYDDGELPVVAAGPGRVVVARLDPGYGPIVELDHGNGLRSRYGFGRYGRSSVQVGEWVAGGETLGSFGSFPSMDIPMLHFGLLLEQRGRFIALDPAPFLFASPSNRQSGFGVSVLNASIRIDDRAELRRLLALGLPLNTIASDGTLPLEWVVFSQNIGIAKDLMAAGADPRSPTWDIHQAAIALHGPSIAAIAGETGNRELLEVLGSR